MRLKKTLYAVAVMVAVASMVLPSVRADIRKAKPYVYDRTFAEKHRASLIQHQGNPKATNALGRQKPLANNGLLSQVPAMEKLLSPERIIPRVEETTILQPGNNKRMSAELVDRVTNPKPVEFTPEMRAMLNFRAPGAATETAAARQAKKAKAYADARTGLTRGGAQTQQGPGGVLPNLGIADNSAFSAIMFMGLAGTEDFFDEALLVGDLDGNLKTEIDFDGTFGFVNRTLIDSHAEVVNDILLPDEIYTAVAVSGHNAANGFGDFNVFYTGTNAGFLSIEGDSVCDGDLLADTSLGVLALTSLGFSTSASITGIAVNTDSEYDGDLASDEIVWFTVSDPELGLPSVAAGALLFMLDSDGDDIPDPAGAGIFTTSSSPAIAGVSVDSYGDVYFHLTDFVVGRILKAWDVDEDRLPDVGFALFNNVNGVFDENLITPAFAVDMTVDRYNSVFLACSDDIAGGVNPLLPANAVISWVDRCGDFDPIVGLIPRQDQFADVDYRVLAASADVPQPAGAGPAPGVLVIPELQIDYSGYAGLEADFDDNIYVAIGAAPAGQSGDPSPFVGAVLKIPDPDCDRVGNSVDIDGDGVFGTVEDYRFMDSPNNPPELTPNGISSLDFGPLFSLSRVGLDLGDDTAISFRFDDFDGEANNVAGGRCDLLFATECDNVGTELTGGPVGFEFLFCNTAWTGFRLGSNGIIDLPSGLAPDSVLDFTPTVVEFLSDLNPLIAPAWTDLTPGGGGQFSIHRLGFAAPDAFIIQYINMPQFGQGGVGVGVDPFGFPKRGNTNSFDVTFFDDQDTWDDVDAEIVGDDTNGNNFVNDDNDGICFPAGVGLNPNNPTQIIDRNGDGDITDESLSFVNQEGVGRTKPEQGPFKFVYHQMEIVGSAAQPALVGFSTGFDGVFNTGTIPPGLCEVNLSAATPAPDDPFFMMGCIGMGTEPSLYEYFNEGSTGALNPDGTITPPLVDFDLRQELFDGCIARPELFIDPTSADCICFKGSNIPVGLFCQSIEIPGSSAFDDPFLGPTTFQINGFCFPMPTTGENAICPQFCGTTAPLCRGGKSVTYSIVYKFDEDGDGIVDATIPFADPDVVVVDENTITVTVDFSQTTLCGGDVEICVFATYGFGDDNKYFENNGTPVVLTCASPITIGARAPVVLSIAPDNVACEDPDDPDNVEDVQIAGLCFFGSLTSAFLATNPDGTGTIVNLSNVINIQSNIATATVPISQLIPDTPYFVFVVRSDGARSTNYPNVFGFDVTFTCTTVDTTPDNPVTLTSCRVVRNSVGKLILQVNGINFIPNDTIVLLNGQPCRTNKYPSRFINPSNGTTTRINCKGGLKNLLPAVVTTRNQSDGVVSDNSLTCSR